MKRSEIIVKLVLIAFGTIAIIFVMQNERRWWVWFFAMVFMLCWASFVWTKKWKSKEKPKDDDKMVNK